MGNMFTDAIELQGLTDADIQTGTITTGELTGPVYLSTKAGVPSAIQPKMISIASVADLQAIVGNVGEADGAKQFIPEPWTQDKNSLKLDELSEADEINVFAALRAMLAGKQAEVQSYADIVNQRYFPMSAGAFSCENIVVSAGSPLIIEPDGHDPVLVNCDTLTLEAGAQIICEAPVIMTVNTFTKN